MISYRLTFLLLAAILVALVLATGCFMQNAQPSTATLNIRVFDWAGKPVEKARVYVFAVGDTGPSRIVGEGVTDSRGEATVVFNLEGDLAAKASKSENINLFIHCYIPGVLLEAKALSIKPPYRASISIRSSKLVNQETITPLSEQEAPELVDYEDRPNQLVWLTEIHSVPGVTQKVTVYEGAVIKVDALTRVGETGSFTVSGRHTISFYKSAWAQVSDGDARVVKGYYTFTWEKWYYPTSREYVEQAYCRRWEGVITKDGVAGGDGELPPYPSGWHYFTVSGGTGLSHGITISYTVSVGASVYFTKIQTTLKFGVECTYYTGFRREVVFGGASDDTYYIYDRGLGASTDVSTWPFIYVAKKP